MLIMNIFPSTIETYSFLCLVHICYGILVSHVRPSMLNIKYETVIARVRRSVTKPTEPNPNNNVAFSSTYSRSPRGMTSSIIMAKVNLSDVTSTCPEIATILHTSLDLSVRNTEFPSIYRQLEISSLSRGPRYSQFCDVSFYCFPFQTFYSV